MSDTENESADNLVKNIGDLDVTALDDMVPTAGLQESTSTKSESAPLSLDEDMTTENQFSNTGYPIDGQGQDLDKINDNFEHNADNLSLEVNFGDGSSCRASDVSSISFQNIILDDPEFDFDPYSYNNRGDLSSLKDSISESSESPLHDFPNEDDGCIYSDQFAEEIKLRECSRDKSKKCSGDGCGTDDELPFDSVTENGTLKRVVKNNPILELCENKPMLTAYFPASAKTNTSSIPSVSNTGGGSVFTNKKLCTDGIGFHGTFQGPKPECDDITFEGSSDQHSLSSSDHTVSGKPESGSDCDIVHTPKTPTYGNLEDELTVGNNFSTNILKEDYSASQDVRNSNLNNSNGRLNTGGNDPVPKIYRRSPGLARRMAEERDSSSSEKELDTTEIDTTVRSGQKDLENKMKIGVKPQYNISKDNKNSVTVEKKLKQSIIENLRGFSPEKQTLPIVSTCNSDAYVNFENVLNEMDPFNQNANISENGKDVENEYDYVKYARVQNASSNYVGMRLAKKKVSETNPPESMVIAQVIDDHYPVSSREGSPDKIKQLQQKRRELNEPIKVSKVNEESLTEISLNGSDRLVSEKNFSLSPEMTECDSAEVESVLSDEGKSNASGMPNVEDGLSCSEGSDAEDFASSHHKAKLPKEIVKQRHKHGIQQELQHPRLNDEDVKDFFAINNSGDALSSNEGSPAHKEAIRRKKDALDLAIQDIKVAIERSKQEPVGDDSEASHQAESNDIWVMRDSYAKKLQRDDEFEEVRYELERRREENYHNQEHDEVYQVENDDEACMKYQYSRNDGKSLQPAKGYDSDDEYTDSRIQGEHKRLNSQRGKGYSSVPADDPVEKAYVQSTPQPNSSHRVYGPAMFFSNSKRDGFRSEPTSMNKHVSNVGDNTKATPSPPPTHPYSHHNQQQSAKMTKSDSSGGLSKISSKEGSRPGYNNLSGTIPGSRYKSEEKLSEESAPISDRDRILQSYGYEGSNTVKATSASSLTHESGHSNNSSQTQSNVYRHNSHQHNHSNNIGNHHHEQHHQPQCSYHSSHINHPGDHPEPQHLHHHTHGSYQSRQDDDYVYTGSSDNGKHSQSEPNLAESQIVSGEVNMGGGESDNKPTPERNEDEHLEDEVYQDDYYSGEPAVYVKRRHEGDFDTDEETDELLHKQYHKADEKVDIPELSTPPVNREAQVEKRKSRVREGEQESLTLRDPDNHTVLIEGVLFRARYLGSTTLISEGQPSKSMRMMQAQEAVGRIKAPEGENQPSTDVDLFVSTEKIMVLNTNLQEIMMDHSLRTISYIADIGDVIVIMARRGPVSPVDGGPRKHQSKICCHVFETDEGPLGNIMLHMASASSNDRAQLIAQSIGQAFQVAYMEFLKANGIEDPTLMKEMDYQEVLNQQEIFGEELFLFSNKETQKEVIYQRHKCLQCGFSVFGTIKAIYSRRVIVPKMKNEALGVVIVESGWGSMVPTVVLANMSPTGAAARCGQLNIGDQIMSINGVSLVGLPLSSCQNYIKAAKNQTVVKLNVVSCAPVVEVLVKRPDVKYQLGFSVQNGVICSLLRGGIAERGGVRVGHRIIEINGSSVVAVAHEKIVNMLATAVGEIHMKTMPTSIFRLLTGQETPHYI